MTEVQKEELRRLSQLTQNQALGSTDKDLMDADLLVKLQCITKAP